MARRTTRMVIIGIGPREIGMRGVRIVAMEQMSAEIHREVSACGKLIVSAVSSVSMASDALIAAESGCEGDGTPLESSSKTKK